MMTEHPVYAGSQAKKKNKKLVIVDAGN